jgi:hypothetical protein
MDNMEKVANGLQPQHKLKNKIKKVKYRHEVSLELSYMVKAVKRGPRPRHGNGGSPGVLSRYTDTGLLGGANSSAKYEICPVLIPLDCTASRGKRYTIPRLHVGVADYFIVNQGSHSTFNYYCNKSF